MCAISTKACNKWHSRPSSLPFISASSSAYRVAVGFAYWSSRSLGLHQRPSPYTQIKETPVLWRTQHQIERTTNTGNDVFQYIPELACTSVSPQIASGWTRVSISENDRLWLRSKPQKLSTQLFSTCRNTLLKILNLGQTLQKERCIVKSKASIGPSVMAWFDKSQSKATHTPPSASTLVWSLLEKKHYTSRPPN